MQKAVVTAVDRVSPALRLLHPMKVTRPPWGGPAAAAGNGHATTRVMHAMCP
jgi:hypothetical protein